MMPLLRTGTARPRVNLGHLPCGTAPKFVPQRWRPQKAGVATNSDSKVEEILAVDNNGIKTGEQPGQIDSPVSDASKKKPRKTQAQIDEELRLKMEGIAGEGGESGVEYEDGKPVAMKRGVRENMFRYI
ncbi:hypothetical protein VTK26DRAFT_8992 [Humicola hyalothermophila]